jgi:hypothetical protein
MNDFKKKKIVEIDHVFYFLNPQFNFDTFNFLLQLLL